LLIPNNGPLIRTRAKGGRPADKARLTAVLRGRNIGCIDDRFGLYPDR
jgi:hypothetical protein